MPTFKEITAGDVKTSRSFLNQLVDIVQEDISGSTTRRKHLSYVTGGVGPGVTSSLFHTVYDQNFNLQTANAVLDLTFGIFSGSYTVASSSTGQDSAGKLLFPSESLMMREKVNVYKQFAQILLGNGEHSFTVPFDTTMPARDNKEFLKATNDTPGRIDHALFICFKRLFARDKIKRETFAMKYYASGAITNEGEGSNALSTNSPAPNINITTTSGSTIITDVGAASTKLFSEGGEIGNLVSSADTSVYKGLIFYDQGIVVLDMDRAFSGSQHMSGAIDAMADFTSFADGSTVTQGTTIIGSSVEAGNLGLTGNPKAKFIPDFVVSASMDNVLDHIASTRFQSGTLTSMTFQNVTNINSTLIFCRLAADEFNYSTNPTFKDTSTGRINVIDPAFSDTERTFTQFTSVGLYDSANNLLAIAKLSRPVEKNDEKEITVRVRLDF